MKTVISIILFTLAFGSLIGQDDQSVSQNELKTNVLNDLFGIVTLNYERLLNVESGVGINLGFVALEGASANLTLAPYYRLYFGKKRAAGFFLEGTATIVTYDASGDDNDNGITGGIGFAVGTKLLTKKDWVFEGFAGVTRLFLDTDIFGNDGGSGFAYPRLGLSIGKRF